MKNYQRFISFLLLIAAVALSNSLVWSATTTKPASAAEKPGNTSAATHKVDLNTATKAELESLPGVGPATASEIVAIRPFQRVEDLKNVKGIGPARFEELRPHVTVSQKNTSRTVSPNKEQVREVPREKVDLNTADAATLQNLPGVGPNTAQNIIAARPFKSVSDLQDVKGIGPTRYEQLRPFVTVHSTTSKSSGSAPATVRGTSREVHPGGAPTALGKGAEQKATGNTAETKININTASREELESLLGIGPAKAQAIIDNRPYSSIEDVMKVKGIKEGIFDDIKDRIRVR